MYLNISHNAHFNYRIIYKAFVLSVMAASGEEFLSKGNNSKYIYFKSLYLVMQFFIIKMVVTIPYISHLIFINERT